MITYCEACGPRPGGGTPSLASARWTFAYKSGAERSADLCAACGFKQLAHAAILTAALTEATHERVSRRKGRRGVPAELREMLAQLLRVKQAMAKFTRKRT